MRYSRYIKVNSAAPKYMLVLLSKDRLCSFGSSRNVTIVDNFITERSNGHHSIDKFESFNGLLAMTLKHVTNPSVIGVYARLYCGVHCTCKATSGKKFEI